jgi:SAM-dependent methyltransferase
MTSPMPFSSLSAGTVITADYLPWARVAVRSFLENHPGAAVQILFADYIPHDQLQDGDHFTSLSLKDVDLSPDEITWLNLIYSPLELSCALKPLLLGTMLQSAESAIYMDADMRLYDSVAEVGELASKHGLVLSPHALAPRITPDAEHEEVLMRMGQFNAGFLAVGQAGRPFLDWWWSKLARECHDIARAIPHRFLDQRWLDAAVGYFPNTIHRDVGTNVARWNLFQRKLELDGDRYLVNGEPLRLFHFSAFDPAKPSELRPDELPHPSLHPHSSPPLRRLLDDYAAELIDGGWKPRSGRAPVLNFDGVSLTPAVRGAIGAALVEAERHRVVPSGISSNPNLLGEWLRTPVTSTGLNWYLFGLQRSEPRVRSTFPNVPGTDELRYLAWAAREGVSQGLVPAVVALGPDDNLAASDEALVVAAAQTDAAAEQDPTVTSGARPARVQPSENLLRFTGEFRNERESILEFALRAAAEIPDGSLLLDVGAGNSPYRELFHHLRYESHDWQHSMHPGARAVDHVGPAHEIPVADGAYDAVLCTQVLEHVPNPQEVLDEIWRVLRPGGALYMTVPLAWELHELPFDFFRHTPHGLSTMLTNAGFEKLDIRARNDSFRTVAQMIRNLSSMVGPYPDGRDAARAQLGAAMSDLAARVESLRALDSRWIFPLGFSVRATKASVAPSSEPIVVAPGREIIREAVGLGTARSFVTLCFASDLLADPTLLSAYANRFTDGDDATLAIYAPDVDVQLADRALTHLVEGLGLNGPDSPDMIALPHSQKADEPALAAAADAVLALRPPWGEFTGLPWAHTGTLEQIHAAAAERSAVSQESR